MGRHPEFRASRAQSNREEEEYDVHPQRENRSRPPGLRFLVAALALLLVSSCQDVEAGEQRSFATPEAATQALLEAMERDDQSTLLLLIGREHADAIITPDWDADRQARQQIAREAKRRHELNEVREGQVQWVIGDEAWPFPIPIVREDGVWRFDTAKGLEELIDRRVGRNELTAISILHAYVDAQIEYASDDRDGDDTLEYAQRLASSPDKRDGLYWPTAPGEEPSPLGPAVQGAERYLETRRPAAPIRGYYFQILTKQGANAPGGAYEYVRNGDMLGGFALLAYPADYGSSGVMTFAVNHQGRVHQKDLGAFSAMDAYDPDDSWSVVED